MIRSFGSGPSDRSSTENVYQNSLWNQRLTELVEKPAARWLVRAGVVAVPGGMASDRSSTENVRPIYQWNQRLTKTGWKWPAPILTPQSLFTPGHGWSCDWSWDGTTPQFNRKFVAFVSIESTSYGNALKKRRDDAPQFDRKSPQWNPNPPQFDEKALGVIADPSMTAVQPKNAAVQLKNRSWTEKTPQFSGKPTAVGPKLDRSSTENLPQSNRNF